MTPAETSTRELPAAGHLAPTPTVAQSTTATKSTLQPPTPVNALVRLQSQVITNVVDFLSTLKPRTPVNVELLESYLEGHPDPHFVTSLCSGLLVIPVPGHTRFTLIYTQPTYTQISLNKTF